MVDSWSQIPRKIKYGNTFDFGNYDQCLQVHTETNQLAVITQYCLFQFYSNFNETVPRMSSMSSFNSGWKQLDQRFGFAICLPAVCEPKTVKKILIFLLEGSDYSVADDYEQAEYCKTLQTSTNFSKLSIATFCIIIVIIFCVTSSTCYDLKTKKKKCKRNEFLLAFSFRKNVSSLIELNIEPNNEITSFNCIRVLSSICLLHVHLVFSSFWFPLNNFVDVDSGLYSHAFKVIGSFMNAFFVISGFFATHSIIDKIKRYCYFLFYFATFPLQFVFFPEESSTWFNSIF